jgi:hypothetical protein
MLSVTALILDDPQAFHTLFCALIAIPGVLLRPPFREDISMDKVVVSL